MNRHEYDTASSAGLFGMEIQGTTEIFVVNLKRILKLLSGKKADCGPKSDGNLLFLYQNSFEQLKNASIFHWPQSNALALL